MNKDLVAIFEYLEREKGIKREVVISAIEDALRIAARKSIENVGEPIVTIDKKTGDIDVVSQKTIVNEVTDPEEEISLESALALNPDCKVGQRLEISITPKDFGRIAAQTARQVIAQKLRGAERDVIFEEYRHRINEVISGTVKRFLKGNTIVVDLGKVEAILPEKNYPKTERYNIGERVQALLLETRDTDNGGAEVILSRSHPEFVSALFAQEVPEIEEGIISIEKIVREAGYRTKMAVVSTDPKIDPVGTCVGVRGARIKNIIRELNNEKIDVFPYSEDLFELLKNAVAPIEILRFKLINEENKISMVVSDEDYPAIIGKKGMNARLLSKLVDKEVSIQKISEYQKLVIVQMAELADSQNPILEKSILQLEGISKLILEELQGAGFDTIKKVALAQPQELSKSAPGVNYLTLAEKILEQK